MPESIRIEGVQGVREMIAALAGELPVANQRAQDAMAFRLRDAEQDQMRQDIDKPTPFSVNAVLYKKFGPAGIGQPKVEGAAVYLNDAFSIGSVVGADQYLGVQTLGGQTAGPRRSEELLQLIGVMRPDQVWVPDKAVKLDAYGNVPGPLIARMLMDLRLNPYAYTKTRNFALIGKPAIGVITKIGDEWFPFLWFVDRVTTYRPKYRFYERADLEVSAHFKPFWDEQVTKALERAAR
jgi:hypothetical protein